MKIFIDTLKTITLLLLVVLVSSMDNRITKLEKERSLEPRIHLEVIENPTNTVCISNVIIKTYWRTTNQP